MTAFRRFAWVVLAYHVAVVAWGALVRATGSGAGCGQHWPMCNGQVVPISPALETAIEFTHRATSGIALLLVAALVAFSRRAFPRGHAARRAAGFSALFIVTEALLGAGLVLFGWVAKDASAGRGWAMALHLSNTFLLLAALALTAGFSRPTESTTSDRAPGALPLLVALGITATMIAGVSGAIAALGDTLFPATSFVEGLREELAPGTRVLLRLRIVHPLAAFAAAIALWGTAWVAAQAHAQRHVRRAAVALATLVGAELVAGVANVFLLAPVWLQLVHLVLADAIWITLVLLVAWALASTRERAAAAPTVPATAAAPR